MLALYNLNRKEIAVVILKDPPTLFFLFSGDFLQRFLNHYQNIFLQTVHSCFLGGMGVVIYLYLSTMRIILTF